MDLHKIRAHQGTFSPSNGSLTNPDITVSGSQGSGSPQAQTFIFSPNPLLPSQPHILQSIPWGRELEMESPLASPAHLLSPYPSDPSQLSNASTGYGGGRRGGGGQGGLDGMGVGVMNIAPPGSVGGGRFAYLKPARRVTPYRGFAYTPTRPSTGRLSRLTLGDPNRECGVLCWGACLFACAAIVTLGVMWLFQVTIFAHHDWPDIPTR